MIPIAGVLLLIVVVFTIAVVVSNPGIFNLSIFGANVPVTAAGLYFVGAGAMLVLILATALLRRGVKRELRRRRQVKTLRTAASGATRPVQQGPASAPKQTVAATPTFVPDPTLAPNPTSGPDNSAGSDTPAGAAPPAPAGAHAASKPSDWAAPSPSGAAPTDPATPTAAERQALLDEAEELTGDSSER